MPRWEEAGSNTCLVHATEKDHTTALVKGILLEVGHGVAPSGAMDPGAIGINPKNEYELNSIAAKAAQRLSDRPVCPVMSPMR